MHQTFLSRFLQHVLEPRPVDVRKERSPGVVGNRNVPALHDVVGAELCKFGAELFLLRSQAGRGQEGSRRRLRGHAQGGDGGPRT